MNLEKKGYGGDRKPSRSCARGMAVEPAATLNPSRPVPLVKGKLRREENDSIHPSEKWSIFNYQLVNFLPPVSKLAVCAGFPSLSGCFCRVFFSPKFCAFRHLTCCLPLIFSSRNSMSAHVRKIKRVILRHRASLVINLDANQKRLPCLIVGSSKSGFRLRGISRIKTGELVELLVEESLHGHSSQRCRVAWVGKAGTKHAGDVGLEIA